MNIKNMRWAYDGGGIQDGQPMEGNTLVEIVVTDENGSNFFVTNSRHMDYGMVYIAEIPLLDILLESNYSDVNFEHELGKVENYAIEQYEYMVQDDFDESILESGFIDIIRLSFVAMEKCYPMQYPEDNEAKQFIHKYLKADVKDLNIPRAFFDK